MKFNITDTKQIQSLLKDWNVLVVEDDPDIRIISSIMLKRSGATVVTASNGREALEAVKTKRPHFILSDLNMPVMDGWEMMSILNRDRATLDIPVIALTAVDLPGDRTRAVAAGFVNFIVKPLVPKKFLTELLNILIDIPEMRLLIETAQAQEN